jgi:hypothetical protein
MGSGPLRRRLQTSIPERPRIPIPIVSRLLETLAMERIWT